jgi:hypothetical protein
VPACPPLGVDSPGSNGRALYVQVATRLHMAGRGAPRAEPVLAHKRALDAEAARQPPQRLHRRAARGYVGLVLLHVQNLGGQPLLQLADDLQGTTRPRVPCAGQAGGRGRGF